MEELRDQGKTELAFKEVGCRCQQWEQEWPRDGSSLSGKARRWLWASLLDPGRQMRPVCLVPCSGTFAVYKQSYFRAMFWIVSLWGNLLWGKAMKSSTTGWCNVTQTRMPSANPFYNCRHELTIWDCVLLWGLGWLVQSSFSGCPHGILNGTAPGCTVLTCYRLLLPSWIRSE